MAYLNRIENIGDMVENVLHNCIVQHTAVGEIQMLTISEILLYSTGSKVAALDMI